MDDGNADYAGAIICRLIRLLIFINININILRGT
jgi:hypothetical protein